jgi:tetratricopeptide (TPR) repeat protein
VEEDPEYAPAWARLGRCHRVLGKAGEEPDANAGRAESCFHRALELNPDLAVAHALYAMVECDLGKGRDAMVRLLQRAREGAADAELFAGLVHACRYSGLLPASVAAHERARALDPQIMTSIRHTRWLMGEFEGALEGIGFYFDALVLVSLGRAEEARARLREREFPLGPGWLRAFVGSLRALLEGHREESLAATEEALTHMGSDPEAAFYMARQFARLGEHERAVQELQGIADRGYLTPPVLERDPWLDPLRGRADFEAVMLVAAQRHRESVAAYEAAGGRELLGVGGDG